MPQRTIAELQAKPTLLRLAYAFEQATRVRVPPAYLPTVPLED